MTRIADLTRTPAVHGHHGEMEECIKNCQESIKVCTATLEYCKKKGGAYAAPEHLNALLDCIASCTLSVDLMTRHSKFHKRHCLLCADICKTCEDSCLKFTGDAQLKACADQCHKCSESCRKMGSSV